MKILELDVYDIDKALESFRQIFGDILIWLQAIRNNLGNDCYVKFQCNLDENGSPIVRFKLVGHYNKDNVKLD